MNYNIKFLEEGHIYLFNGVKADISITQLLSKHGLSPDYSNVDKEVLNKAAKRGTNYHKELENIITDRDYEPITEQGVNYKIWFDKNVECGDAEVVIGIDYKGLKLCGCVDDLLLLKNGTFTIDDHKFNATFHKEYVRWQLSLINFIIKFLRLNDIIVNGNKFTNFINPKLNVDFFKTGETTFERIELDPVKDEEIIKLLEAEVNGEIYKPVEAILDISKEEQQSLIDIEAKLAELELEMKKLKAQKDKNRALVRDTLLAQKVKQWTSPNGIVKYTLVDEVNSVELDTAQLKLREPELYAKLIKSYPKQKKKNAYVLANVNVEKYNEVKQIEEEIKTLKIE